MRKHWGTPSWGDEHVTLAAISPPSVARGRFVGGHQSGLAGCKLRPLYKRRASSCSSQRQRQWEPWGASPRPSAPAYLPTCNPGPSTHPAPHPQPAEAGDRAGQAQKQTNTPTPHLGVAGRSRNPSPSTHTHTAHASRERRGTGGGRTQPHTPQNSNQEWWSAGRNPNPTANTANPSREWRSETTTRTQTHPPKTPARAG